jgi:hypothetical protein
VKKSTILGLKPLALSKVADAAQEQNGSQQAHQSSS